MGTGTGNLHEELGVCLTSSCTYALEPSSAFSGCTSTLSALHLWVEAFEFDTRISGGKTPIDSDLSVIRVELPKAYAALEGRWVGNTTVKALTRQHS